MDTLITSILMDVARRDEAFRSELILALIGEMTVVVNATIDGALKPPPPGRGYIVVRNVINSEMNSEADLAAHLRDWGLTTVCSFGPSE